MAGLQKDRTVRSAERVSELNPVERRGHDEQRRRVVKPPLARHKGLQGACGNRPRQPDEAMPVHLVVVESRLEAVGAAGDQVHFNDLPRARRRRCAQRRSRMTVV
jgi:hypothetical protein